MAKPAKKDLPVSKDIKGGKLAGNDNMSLVRAAKSDKKDLPATKDVKGGRLAGNDSLTLARG